MFNCGSACADAIQTRPHRLKMFILYSKQFHRTNVPSLEKMRKRATFLILGTHQFHHTTRVPSGIRRDPRSNPKNYRGIQWDPGSIVELHHGIRLDHGPNAALVERSSGIIDPTLGSTDMSGYSIFRCHLSHLGRGMKWGTYI